MRYLQLISSLDPAGGGPAEGVRQLAEAARRLGHDVEVATLDAPDVSWGRDFPCPVHYLGPCRLGTYRLAPRLKPWLQANAARFVAVVVNGLWQYHGLATWQALRGTPTPYFVYTHGMLDPWFKKQYPLKHLKKSLYWPWAEYRVLRDARAVLFTCEEERLLARQSFDLYRAEERVVSYGTPGPDPGDPDVQREAFLQAYPQLRGKRLILFLGRIHPKKGCDLLIDAFAAVSEQDPALHLVIAGPDFADSQPELSRRARELGLSRITWTGMLKGEQKWGAFRAAEAFVLPSHQENFGIAVAEALACQVPVLISNKVNIWREIEQDRAGIVEDDTLEGTLRLLQRWQALSPAERRTMADNAEPCFIRRFHIETAAKNLLNAIEVGSQRLPQAYPT
jgi:glycosyltransferase involved in cell wall biosynthesis